MPTREYSHSCCSGRRVISLVISLVGFIIFMLFGFGSRRSSSTNDNYHYPSQSVPSYPSYRDDLNIPTLGDRFNLPTIGSISNKHCLKYTFGKAIQTSNSSVNTKQCLTQECEQVADVIKGKLNTNINPCDDFYTFACGNWLTERRVALNTTKTAYRDNFELLSERLSSRFNGILEEPARNDPKPLQYAKMFYKSCLNLKPGSSATLKEFKSVVDQLLVSLDTQTTLPDLFKTLAELRRDLGDSNGKRIYGNYIFSVTVQFDTHQFIHGIKDAAQKFQLKPGQLSGDTKDEPIYDSPLYPLYKIRYISWIQEAWAEIYPNQIWESELVARQVANLEEQLARLRTQVTVERLEDRSFYRNATIFELNSITRSMKVRWEDVFGVLMNGTGISLNFQQFKLNIMDLKYFLNLGRVLSSVPMDQIKNYLKWRIILEFGPQLGIRVGSLLDVTDHLDQNIRRHCAEVSEEYFGMAVLYRYIQLHFDDRLIDSLKSLVTNVKGAFNNLIDESSCFWLDKRHVPATKMKLEKMKLYAAYPVWLKNVTGLNEFYQGLVLKEGNTGIQNLMTVIRYKSILYLQGYGKQKDLKSSLWPIQPTDVNAAYHVTHNSIAIPAAILESPLFGMPMQYQNYGALGVIIGHEILHGFDPTGILFNDEGSVDIQWTYLTQSLYVTRSQCFVRQFNAYLDENTGQRYYSETATFKVAAVMICDTSSYLVSLGFKETMINGTATLDENVADSGGIRAAYEAYQTYVRRFGEEERLPSLNYTSDQMFFLSYAQTWCRLEESDRFQHIRSSTDPHTANKYRVRGSLHNFDKFHQAWGCPVSAKTDTCRVW